MQRFLTGQSRDELHELSYYADVTTANEISQKSLEELSIMTILNARKFEDYEMKPMYSDCTVILIRF